MSDHIRHIIADALGVPLDKVEDHAELHDDLGADSLEVVALINTLEEELNLELGFDAWRDLKTVQDVIRLVTKESAHVS